MKNQKKRKLFLGVSPIGGPVLKSRRHARKITSKFHSIQNKVYLLEKKMQLDEKQLNNTVDLLSSSSSSSHGDFEKDAKCAIDSLKSELQLLGGRNRYQQASIVSTQHFKTSRCVKNANNCQQLIFVIFLIGGLFRR